MSGATYRIDVEHQPDPTSSVQWVARVIRLSDDWQQAAMWGATDDEAIEKARAYLHEQNVKQTGRTLYVNDDGRDTDWPHPQSVKA